MGLHGVGDAPTHAHANHWSSTRQLVTKYISMAKKVVLGGRVGASSTVADVSTIAIVGAGSAGLFLADRLARLGVSPLVVDKFPLAAYSTTRNQGWLQSGAFYAAKAKPQADAVEHCRAGYEEVLKDCPEAVLDEVACYMLFENSAQMEQAARQCHDFGLTAEPLSDAEFIELQRREPLVAGTRFVSAMRTQDRPVNTTVLMSKVAARAEASGARFAQVECVHCVSLKRVPRGWRVALGQGRFEDVATVVVAAGPYTGELLRVPAPAMSSQLLATKIPVLTLMNTPDYVLRSMLVAPRAIGAPNLVPFRSVDGSGVTVCLNGADQPCDERGPLDEEPPQAMSEAFLQSLTFWYPSIQALAAHQFAINSVVAHFHMCQKLEGQTRGPILVMQSEGDTDHPPDRTLLAVYPGKFTAAPSVADLCVKELEAVLGAISGPSIRGSGDVPGVARQPYYDRPTHWLHGGDGSIALESVLP